MAADQHVKPHPQVPVGRGAELERTAPIDESVEGIGPGDEGHHRRQRRRLLGGGRPLGEPVIGGAEGAHPAIAAGKRRRPGDGVGAVLRLVPERIPVPVRCEATPGVLDDHHVAAARRLDRIEHRGADREVLPIGQARHDHRPAALTGGAIDVGAQDDTVAHRRGHVEIHCDRCRGQTGLPSPRLIAYRLRGGAHWPAAMVCFT